ncbi:hypothetical protein QCA50_012496 [Cerrena zonata]|uniref:VWFA domain-containing protein n=1 Tax=Cerrena zonata TaxID=2478898 RepID=A0AAW0G2D6_9APHY
MAQVLEPQDSIGPEPAINSDLTPPSYDTDSFPIARDSSPPAQIESNQVGDNEARTSDLVPEGYDVVDSIKGMYRILDLVSEQGSGGLVEKIIISQESLGHFINDICPGAYRSMTKVDFTALDRLTVKPMGIYGSRSEIVRYLYDVGVVDDGTVAILRSSEDGDRNSLRTGIYILRPSHCSISSVIFWPEDTTWNDEAAPSVQRNRVTFMRYLTKICTQVFALISDEDASMIVWREVIQQHNSEDEAENIDLDIDDVDRFFSFKVIQTNEQEENVVVRPGFTVSLPQSNNLRYNEYVDVEFDHMRPRLVAGETEAGYLDVKYASSLQKCQTFPEKYNAIRLRSFLEKDAFILSSDLQEDALQILLRHGLGAKRSPRVIQAFHESRQLLQDEYERRKQKAWEETNNTWHSLLPQAIRHELARTVLSNYSSRVQNAVYDRLSQEQVSELQAVVHGLFVSCPDVPARILQASNDLSFSKITSNPYEIKKQGLLKIMHTITGTRTDHWTQQELQELARNVWEPQKHYMSLRSVVNGWWATLSSTPEQRSAYASSSHSEYDEGMLTDAECLSRLETFFSNFRIFDADVEEIFLLAAGYLKDALERQITEVMHYLDQLRSKAFRKVLENIEADHCNQNIESRRRFLADVRHSYLTDSKTIRIIENVRIIENGRRQVCYEISGYLKRCIDESLVYRVFPFKVSEQDMQEMQMSADFIPSPRLHPRSSFSFCTPVTDKVVFIQLLQDDRCLLVIESNESLNIYLERMDAIGKALENRMPKRTLRMERINCDYLLAFNESKRILALCTTNKSLLHFFVFDERFMSCSGLGPRVTLTLWYLESDTHSLLTHAAFLCGPNEEALALVDDGGSVRVFSLITQQFRPSSVTLPQPAIGLYSSPDGSCLFVACANSNKISLRAYHSSTFGHTEGIHLEIPGLPISSPIMTSIGNRSKTYYVGLDDEARCISFALDITSRPAEFSFRERQKSYPLSSTYRKTLRNSLLDCHADVWTRFPVLSAIRRSTSNTMSFVSTLDPTQIQNYIKDSILNFQRITKKPTGRELSEMVICGMPYEAFRVSKNNDLSIYKLGQWLVNLLCLIPIHIAVAWENRFVPLKDGVWSRGFEESLLGATVEQIVDNLSFGWYESILKSYMSSKPVRVVSSMGEQSVGKSFTLNHLVDTSFAGSAMRTTEGVWMSLTPTDDALIVALDFEGVHSLERSIQEDSLLVLFNTALSNLVLFRNNFALSRSITDLFHSFQSSSTVLDTAANPTLFRSTLAIIIKDVIQSDKEEIKKEFSLRFQSIVDTEKESNFITKLHNGNVLIIPWPVIESREFYGMFRPLGKMLEEQDVTHPKGAMFLETMKTLMAKLKANDWGALNQNIALHRAQQLVLSLPTAFAYGVVELEPEIEPLRDLDSGNVIETFDTSAKFYVTGTRVNSEDQEHVLIYLLSSSGHFDQRYDQDEHHWVTGLQKYLDDLVEARIAHVQEWMNTNMSRFQPEVESSLFEEVRRLFADLSISLHATIKICASQCSSCQLFCLRPMHHEGSHSCNTDHKCPRFCEYAVDHDGESVQCGLPAGHRGTHICDFSTHRCGKDCYLSGKDGCLHFCAKSVDHADGDHDCLEPHECGKPCILANVRLADGSLFTCRYTCRKLSHVSHEEHVCDDHNCPISCQLCKRLCASSSHLHALDKNAIHLCGQEHPCLESCQSPGLCLIETTPESIEAIFTGRYETFQYTKVCFFRKYK